MKIDIEQFDHGEMGPTLVAELVGVYAAAFALPPYSKRADEVSPFRTALPEHATRRGFRLFTARDGGRLIGFAYGYDLWGQRWLYGELKPLLLGTDWLQDAYQLVEFAVDPAYHRRGIGRQLYDALWAQVPHRHQILCTMAADTPAFRFYQKYGWLTLIDQHQFPGAKRLYRVMGRKG